MAWSIAEVARMAKVTSRTLRHYHDIGLLPPAWTGPNGYRYYEREQLLRLQEILVLRQLGVGLETIAEIVQDGRDRVAALRAHHRALLAERDRFQSLADTVATTIKELEGGDEMAKPSVDHWFTGFDAETQQRYEAEASERWGDESVQASREKVKDWGPQEWDRSKQAWADTLTGLVKLIEAGAQPDDPRVFDVLDGHYRWIDSLGGPTQESYARLGDLYADDPRFRRNFDRTHPELAEFMRQAMARYAEARLS
jgi:DNA-binding transcriptional MerR regulator